MPSADSIAFSPLQVGDLTLPHRIVMAPMTRLRVNPDDSIAPIAREYYAQRASFPGTLLISEGTAVHPRATGYGGVHIPLIFTDKQVEAWRKVVDAGEACL